jgi:hypothetical protein
VTHACVSVKVDHHDPEISAMAARPSWKYLAKHGHLFGLCSTATMIEYAIDPAKLPQSCMASPLPKASRGSLTEPVALLFLVILALDEAGRQ